MHEQYSKLIISLPLFKGYTAEGAQRLINSGAIKDHPAGEIVFKEGDAPTCVLLVLSGKLQVYVEREGKELILTDGGPGTIIGELAVLCGLERAASVRVVEPSSVLEWDDDDFRGLLLKDAFLSQRIFRQSLRTLIEKERSLIASLTQAQSKPAST
ncbi:MAG TPA: cyclic nucleotide-binding domain-containing protein [Pyrinomonadaceae bacterium]|nr:cyclic nucleotide-binding domain-containing protein [Pyrinomonadaceae bacterium]